MTDIEIIELYWKRSEEAIVRTTEKYGRYLLRIAVNILHIHEEAEECVNETYLSAWNQLPPDKPDKLLPYRWNSSGRRRHWRRLCRHFYGRRMRSHGICLSGVTGIPIP